MLYAVDLREHDDINGICVGKTYRLYEYNKDTMKVTKDISEKTFYTRGCNEDDVNNTFDVWFKMFDDYEEASNYYEAQGGYSEVYNPVWDVIESVFKPKNI